MVMKTRFLAKFKVENESTCIVCSHYLTCHRIRAGDGCFNLHSQIYDDMKLVYPEYFVDRKNKALKLLED